MVSRTAGGVSATAVAHPVEVTWTTGDGGQVACAGPGAAYDPGLPSGGQGSTCTHTYLRTSLGQPSPDGDPDDAGRRFLADFVGVAAKYIVPNLRD